MPTLKQDASGQYFLDTGGGVLQPLSEEQAQAVYDNPDAGSGMFEAAGQGLENLITGAGSLLSDNPYWQQENQQGRAINEALTLQHGAPAGAAQYAPQAAIGAATGGAGLLPTMGVEAALGAATTPESPLTGAALGAAGAGLGYALPGAARGVTTAGRDVLDRLPVPGFMRRADPMSEIAPNPGGRVPDEVPLGAAAVDAGTPPLGTGTAAAPPSPSANPPTMPPGTPPNPAPRMAERVTSSIEAADPSGQGVRGYRVMEGTMTPEELYARGVPSTPAQRQLLNARNEAEGAAARKAIAEEEASMSHPLFGGNAKAVRDAQQQSATNFATRYLDMPEGVNLTDPALSQTIGSIGDQMDNIANQMGTVPMTTEIRNEFADILGQTTGSHKGQLQQLVDEIGAKADLNGGALTGSEWGEMRTKINKMIDAGTRQGNLGKISDAQELMDVMTRSMEGNLPTEVKAELTKLRKQYAIASTLTKPGVRNADGQINPVSFYNNWKRAQGKKARGLDDVGNFMNTIVTLTQKRTPDSGTAGRLLQAATRTGAGQAASALGLGGIAGGVLGAIGL